MFTGTLVGLGLALIVVAITKVKSVMNKHHEIEETTWVCLNCHQKNSISKEECPHCKTTKFI